MKKNNLNLTITERAGFKSVQKREKSKREGRKGERKKRKKGKERKEKGRKRKREKGEKGKRKRKRKDKGKDKSKDKEKEKSKKEIGPSTESRLSHTIFDRAVQHVLYVLESEPYPRWLSSQRRDQGIKSFCKFSSFLRSSFSTNAQEPNIITFIPKMAGR